ncbi:MAG: GntR family transcriptional regulator [Balneolaceae bacterium]|nr:MAG: GntR family transcriptional regulator [Balneolaceae bacterium]
MPLNIRIDKNSPVPKYLQVVDAITGLVAGKVLVRGSRLPTINELCKELGVGRVTVVNAYEELKKRDIINATQGKGFYVKNPSIAGLRRVFLLFDAMNGYKEVLYRSFVQALGPKYNISIYFFYYNYQEFCRMINASLGHYDHYVVLPHFNFDVSRPLLNIPREKLLMMDNDVATLKEGYAAVYQSFHKDIFNGLSSGLHLIRKYSRINLVLQHRFQFIPTGIIEGFMEFCKLLDISYNVLESLSPELIRKGEVYFVISDIDLITVVRNVKDNGLILGKDIGLISFDDTPLKTVLANGITTISTDFTQMGKTAAQMIRKGIYEKVENPSQLIMRGSV